MAVPSVPQPTSAGDKANGTTITGIAPLKDDFAAKLPAREALKEKNQKYWDEDAYSKSDVLPVEHDCLWRLLSSSTDYLLSIPLRSQIPKDLSMHPSRSTQP